jgi:flagellar biogenesis protein FliO
LWANQRVVRTTEKELPMSIVTILVIIVLILLAIYLFRRIA